MKTLSSYIDQIKHLADELVKVATKLRDASLNVVCEEELDVLQNHQEEVLDELEKVDQEIQEYYRHQMNDAAQAHLEQQLKVFEALNQEFLKNLHMSHGIIQFDLQRPEDESEKDYYRYKRLNKVTLPPNGSQAIESEKAKKS
jgi:hypothetical protein